MATTPAAVTSAAALSFAAQSRIRVVVRVRPKLAIEKNDSGEFLTIHRSRSASASTTDAKDFVFDQVFDPVTTQVETTSIFCACPSTLLEVGSIFVNPTLVESFARTGSGKTFTMEGYEYEVRSLKLSSHARYRLELCRRTHDLEAQGDVNPASSRIGIIPRVIFNLFEMISAHSLASSTTRREFTIKCSFVQIYNEQILDLFNPSHLKNASANSQSSQRQQRKNTHNGSSSSPGLKLRWSAARGFYVENLRILECQSAQQVLAHFQEGIKHKVMASHRLNAASSRSHCISTIYVESCDPNDSANDILQSKLALADLAGSERIDKTGATGITLQESIGINKSLFVLRQVIQALSEDSSNNSEEQREISTAVKSKAIRGERAYIPYRDSKLTSLLKYSLGGNSLTLMIACLSPSDAHFDENLSTLVYASKAQCIANKPTKNEDPKTLLIHELKLEVEALRKQLVQAQEIILRFQQLPGDSNASTDTDNGDAARQMTPQCMTYQGNAAAIAPPRDHETKSESQRPESSRTQESTTVSSVSRTPANREHVLATKRLKLNVIGNVELIKQLYTTEKALSDRVHTQSTRIGELQHETRVLNVENQSLRDKIEVLEYLVAELPTQRRHGAGEAADTNDGEPAETEESIPGYGVLAAPDTYSSSSSSRSRPRADRIREVLGGSHPSSKRQSRIASPRDARERATNGSSSNQSSHNQRPPAAKVKRKELETGLLSLSELKDLLGGSKQRKPDQVHSSGSTYNRLLDPGRRDSNAAAVNNPARSAPRPPLQASASSSGLLPLPKSMHNSTSSDGTIGPRARTATPSHILSTLSQNPSNQLSRQSAFELGTVLMLLFVSSQDLDTVLTTAYGVVWVCRSVGFLVRTQPVAPGQGHAPMSHQQHVVVVNCDLRNAELQDPNARASNIGIQIDSTIPPSHTESHSHLIALYADPISKQNSKKHRFK
ncbi:Kinesin motor domain containing protein, partial [Globisporangium splendens]